MAKKKETANAFPMMTPMWGWVDQDEQKEQWNTFKNTLETYWAQMEAIQNAIVEAHIEVWNKVLPKIEEMQDTFANSLPETLPGMPEGAKLPKPDVEKMKEFREMAKKHIKEQAESAAEFAKETQKKAKEAVKETVKNVEEKLDEKKA